MRIVAYNLSGSLDATAIAEVLERLEADVVCAVEVPGSFALRRLAGRCGLSVAVRAGRRRQSASAILLGERARARTARAHDLTSPDGVPKRAAAQAIVSVGTIRATVVAVQLGLRPDVRATNAMQIETILGSVDAPAILGGDFNEGPGGPVTGRLSEVLQDAFEVAGQGRGETYPNPDPSTRKDMIFVSRELAVVRAFVPDEIPVNVASHHRPVVVDLAETREEPVGAAAEAGAA